MNRKLVSLVVLFLAPCVCAAQAQVYKWTDAGGVVHYSDAPPPQSTPKVETMHVFGDDRAHPMPADTKPAPKAGDGSKTTTASNGSPQPLSAIMLEERAARCEKARHNLELLQSKNPVALDAAGDGKPQVLDAEARQIQTQITQANITQLCQ